VAHGRVLIVDDEEPIRELCRVNLEMEGFAVSEAADGEEAVERACAELPDVVFLDVRMPRVDGWEALRRLKHHDQTARIPVVLLTAGTSDEDQMRGWQSGIVEFVPKPFNPRALGELARRAMEPRDPDEEEARRRRILDQLALGQEQRRGEPPGP
jgi:DNA-binding response OmpR family regulator